MSLFPQVLVAALLTVGAATAQALPVETQSYAVKAVAVSLADNESHTLASVSTSPAAATFVSASVHNPGSPAMAEAPQPKVWLLLFAALFAASAVMRRRRS